MLCNILGSGTTTGYPVHGESESPILQQFAFQTVRESVFSYHERVQQNPVMAEAGLRLTEAGLNIFKSQHVALNS